MYIAYGKVHDLVTIICTDSDNQILPGKFHAGYHALREKALQTIYELGADDDYKDALRLTLSILPLDEFAHDVTAL